MPIWLLQIVFGIVLSLASTLIQQALAPKAKPSAAAATTRGYRGTIQTGGTVPQSFLVGTVAVPGKLEFRSAWGDAGGTPNAYLTDVISLGDLPITDVTGFFVNSAAVTKAATGHTMQGYPIAEYADHLWWEFFDGSQTTANTYLTGKFGSDPDRPWLTDMIGRGVPYLTMTALIDETLWTGFPTYMAVCQGIRLYDPRLDTTAGGTGSQRWADPSTWAFSDNNIVIVYNILRGIYDADGNHFWGGHARASQVPYDIWSDAMDACDEAVTLEAGGTEPRFRAGREISVAEVPADVIRDLLVGANARIGLSGGVWSVLVGVPATSDGSFTDADVIVTEGTTLDAFPNLDGIVNGATATYIEPAQAWEQKETAPYYRSDIETEDDDRRQLEGLNLSTTFSGTQAQRIIKATVEESRRFARHVVSLPPIFGVYRVLQTLAWTSTANGYTAKLFLITAKTEAPSGSIVLGLQEIDPADHDWTPGTDEQPISFAPMSPIKPGAIPMTGWSVAPYVYPNTAGQPTRIGIEVEFAGGMTDVASVRIQVREDFGSGNTVWDSGEQAYDLTEADPVVRRITWAGIIPATDYEVRGLFISPPASGRVNTWSSWLPVTTANVPPVSAQEIVLAAAEVLGQMGQIRTLIEQFKQFGTLLEGMDRENFTLRNTLSRSIAVKLGDLEASFTEIIEVALGPGGAIATALESLYAAMGGNTAEVNVRWSAQAGVDGYAARYAVQAAVNDGSFRAATLFLDVPTDTGQPTRIGLAAGQTVFLTSTGIPIAAIDEDGIFHSTNDVVQIDMIGGAFSITVP
ncbi:MAG: hypothetical protein ABI216_00615 [Devosia sp.]